MAAPRRARDGGSDRGAGENAETGSPDPAGNAADPLAPLQSAAHEMVSAARSMLDAVEGLIDDRARFASLAGGIADVMERVGETISHIGQRGSAGDADEEKPRVRHVPVD